jgi:hypothetical protein
MRWIKASIRDMITTMPHPGLVGVDVAGTRGV